MQRSKTFCDMASSVRVTSSRGGRSPDLTTIRHDITVLETHVAESKAESCQRGCERAEWFGKLNKYLAASAESKRLDTSTE